MSYSEKHIIFGIHALEEALGQHEIQKVLLKKGAQGEQFNILLSRIREHQIPFQFVPVEKLNRITRKNHQGVIAFTSPVSFGNIEQLIPVFYEEGKDPFVLILDGVTDVRNFGSICRTAECAGVDAIVIPEKGGALITPDAMKTSAGALNHLPVCRVASLGRTIDFLKKSGLAIAGASEKVEQSAFDQSLKGPIALIMGAEDKGIQAELLKKTDINLRVPVYGKLTSLNVSNAASVLIYEIVRQRAK